ncbi:hypothetical protein HY993_00380 [Candidatus Micrarchaeota archaeon]|nr:hypothetical protein [Candidatus Micrarchaeota archaeon]
MQEFLEFIHAAKPASVRVMVSDNFFKGSNIGFEVYFKPRFLHSKKLASSLEEHLDRLARDNNSFIRDIANRRLVFMITEVAQGKKNNLLDFLHNAGYFHSTQSGRSVFEKKF